MARTAIPRDVRIEVLTEAGYRCAVPTCRNILAIDLHHIIEVKDGGPNEPSNLIALCPTCHALYTRGEMSKESIDAWKTMLVALNHAFDKETISNLLFLYRSNNQTEQKTLELLETGELKITKRELNGRVYYQPKNREILKKLDILLISGDGVLKFSHLIGADLAFYYMASFTNDSYLYRVELTDKGKRILEAWFSGNRNAVREALGDLPHE